MFSEEKNRESWKGDREKIPKGEEGILFKRENGIFEYSRARVRTDKEGAWGLLG